VDRKEHNTLAVWSPLPPRLGIPLWTTYSSSTTPTFCVRSPWKITLISTVNDTYHEKNEVKIKRQVEISYYNDSQPLICKLNRKLVQKMCNSYLSTISYFHIQSPSMDKVILRKWNHNDVSKLWTILIYYKQSNKKLNTKNFRMTKSNSIRMLTKK